ncbi:nuclear transport factor 2 family protein [Spirosoma sp. BT702]|uniref:Nuclear transport factor 2 family protein n=1 Tax=Spirosoma profusum TaxID=2771354 RepID=A0A927AW38_9BACT|nr:nuclear transport factor 2 family protein [Spirosoma profusum]MBD2705479.1 nuclear transport factor 2 family protein [Spirosoma profusum]
MCCGSASRHTTSDSVQVWEREVLLTEVRWDEAIVRKDTALLRNVLADNFLLIGADGSLTNKDQLIRYVANPDIITDPFRTEDVQVRFAGETAIVTGRFNQTQHYKGAVYRNAFRYTDVYVRQKGIWKALTAQSTRIPEKPAAK